MAALILPVWPSAFSRSECIPFAFRVYAVYQVTKPLQDKELYSIIDSLNPDLRAIDTFDGKTRTKEFYAMSAEDAYSLLGEQGYTYLPIHTEAALSLLLSGSTPGTRSFPA